MALLTPSPTQGEAFRLWVLDALNRDDQGEPIDPPAFEDAAVYWGDRDHPALPRYAMLQGVALTGPPLLLEYAAQDVGEPDQQLVETRKRWREWTVIVTVAVKLDRSATGAQQHADVASEHLGRVVGAFDGDAWTGCREVGLAPLRLGDVTDAARLRGTTEWETRASVVLTVGAGWYARRSVDWVERA
ncbi:MAG: hypothetical protein ACRCZP_04345, partial [Phycicoccus sp.]